MRHSKSSLPLGFTGLFRALSASSIIVLVVAILAIIRGINQHVAEPLSDDWYMVSAFMAAWCLVPAYLSWVTCYMLKHTHYFKVYVVYSIIQLGIMYGYFYVATLEPDNEFMYSPLYLLAFAAVPVALLYFPLFFWGRADSKLRLASLCLAILLLLYSVFAP